MSEKPVVVGVDFGSKDSTVIGTITRSGVKFIYTLAEGESYKTTDRGYIVVHPDRPPKLVTADGVEEILP